MQTLKQKFNITFSFFDSHSWEQLSVSNMLALVAFPSHDHFILTIWFLCAPTSHQQLPQLYVIPLHTWSKSIEVALFCFLTIFWLRERHWLWFYKFPPGCLWVFLPNMVTASLEKVQGQNLTPFISSSFPCDYIQ